MFTNDMDFGTRAEWAKMTDAQRMASWREFRARVAEAERLIGAVRESVRQTDLINAYYHCGIDLATRINTFLDGERVGPSAGAVPK